MVRWWCGERGGEGDAECHYVTGRQHSPRYTEELNPTTSHALEPHGSFDFCGTSSHRPDTFELAQRELSEAVDVTRALVRRGLPPPKVLDRGVAAHFEG